MSKTAPVKIGIAKNVERRMATMQTGNPRELRIALQTEPMSKKRAERLEKILHGQFRTARLRGEWFSGKILRDARGWLDPYTGDKFPPDEN